MGREAPSYTDKQREAAKRAYVAGIEAKTVRELAKDGKLGVDAFDPPETTIRSWAEGEQRATQGATAADKALAGIQTAVLTKLAKEIKKALDDLAPHSTMSVDRLKRLMSLAKQAHALTQPSTARRGKAKTDETAPPSETLEPEDDEPSELVEALLAAEGQPPGVLLLPDDSDEGESQQPLAPDSCP